MTKNNSKRTELEGRLAYRPAEAARLLGVSSAWIYARIARGELPAAKLGRALFILAVDLVAWIDVRSKQQRALRLDPPKHRR